MALLVLGCSTQTEFGEDVGDTALRAQILPTFTDATAASGIGVNTGNGIWPGHGSWGGVWADVDADGDLDVFTLGHLQPTLCGDNQFWRNNGDGTFREATAELGINDRDGIDLADPDCANASIVEDEAERAIFQQEGTNSCADGWDNQHRIDTHGAVWADFDRDNDLDFAMVNETISGQPWLYHAFWRNDGAEGFAEVADSAGVLGEDHITRGTAAVDYNRDGLLDLFMVTWQAQLAGNPHPDFSPANMLFRNDGNLHFTDVGQEAGVGGPSGAPCTHPGAADPICQSGICGNDGTCSSEKRTAEWFDYDNDGWPDLLINPPCGLLHNDGDGTFTNVTIAAGIAQTEECQGAAISDYDNDGDLDIYTTRGFSRPTPDVLYQNNGDGTFRDVTAAAGISNNAITRAATFGDFDNDGDEDLYVVNFNKPAVANRLFQNDGDGTFTDVGGAAGVNAQVTGFGCALDPPTLTQNPAYCSTWVPNPTQRTAGGSDGSWVDYDSDGDLDLFLTNGEANCRGPYVLLRNNGTPGNHWLKLDLVGTVSNPDAFMSRVTVETAVASRHYMYSGQHHFMTQNNVPLHVGLSDETVAEHVIIEWPNGLIEQFDDLPGDQLHRIVEGTGVPIGTVGTGSGAGSDGGETSDPGTSGVITASGAESNVTDSGTTSAGAEQDADTADGSTEGDETGGSTPAGGFTEVAAEVGLAGRNSSWGMAWADWTNDGYLDVLTYSHLPEITCSRTQLWRNTGHGTFEDVSVQANLASDLGEDTAPLADPDVCPVRTPNCIPCARLQNETTQEIDAHDQGDTHGVVWLDYDRNGCLDYYLINGSTKIDTPTHSALIHYNKLWHNNCDGTFTILGSSAQVDGVEHRGRGAFAFDEDGDGWTDLFSTAFNRAVSDLGNLLHHNNHGDGTFTDIAPDVGVARNDADNRSAAWVDYDNDGLLDIIIAGSTGENGTSSGGPCVLFHHEEDGTFRDVTLAAGVTENTQVVGFAWADYDNDGFFDLYVTLGFSSGVADILYHNDGDGTFTDVTALAGIVNTGQTRGVAAGDYDNDGLVDFYVINLNHGTPQGVLTNTNRLWHNDGDGTFTDLAATERVLGQVFVDGDPPVTTVVRAGMSGGFVDYDQDGQLDISVTNGEGQIDLAPFFLFHNEGHTGHWLEVELHGVESEISGLGAQLEAAGRYETYYRYQSGPHHLLSQSLTPVHFGLGTDAHVTLTITWPSGLVQTIEDLRVDRLIEVTEGQEFVDEPGGDTGGTEGGELTGGDVGTPGTETDGGSPEADTAAEETLGNGTAGDGTPAGSSGSSDSSGSSGAGTTGVMAGSTSGSASGSMDSAGDAGNLPGGTTFPSDAGETATLETGPGAADDNPTEPIDGDGPVAEDAGCSCDTSGKRPPDPILAGFLLGGLGFVRRRRSDAKKRHTVWLVS